MRLLVELSSNLRELSQFPEKVPTLKLLILLVASRHFQQGEGLVDSSPLLYSGSCWFANQPSGGTQQNAAAYKLYEGSYSCYDEEDWRRYWALCSLATPPASLALLGACQHSHLGGWP